MASKERNGIKDDLKYFTLEQIVSSICGDILYTSACGLHCMCVYVCLCDAAKLGLNIFYSRHISNSQEIFCELIVYERIS